MKRFPTILLSMGTRPEIIKMAPVYHQFVKSGVRPLILHTGQHQEMAATLYELFNIVPDYCIDLGRESVFPPHSPLTWQKTDLGLLTSTMMEKITPMIAEIKPDVMLVHGDTTSAMTAALAAFYQKIPVAHIEAGLRSYHAYHPFPEEKNRELVARLARWHFAPTERACQNLREEGIAKENIYVVGNTIVEAAQMGAQQLDALILHSPQFLPESLRSLPDKMKGHRLLLVTAHRRENQESSIKAIAHAVRETLFAHRDLIAVWPVHPNPRIGQTVQEVLKGLPHALAERVYLTEPLCYPILLWVMKHAWLTLTDSGGIQEEAVALRVPVLVARDTTERPEVVECGAGLLIGTKREIIVQEISRIAKDEKSYEAMRQTKNPFGNGKTAKHICDLLLQDLQNETSGAEKKFHD